jgi:hypothetical protein
MLFGLNGSPYIINFIKLLEICNNHFKTLEKNKDISYRNKLIDLLSRNNYRYC